MPLSCAASCSFALLSVVVVAGGLPGQHTFTVGAGTTYPQIADALAVADVGDTVLVLPGSYTGFYLLEGVTIRALVPGTVSVDGGFISQVHAPAGQTAQLVGLRFASLGLIGRAVLDQCVVDGSHGTLTISSATVTMRACTVAPPATPWIPIQNAVNILYSDVSAIDCQFVGHASIPSQSTTAEVALDLVAARFRGSFLTLIGGSGDPQTGYLPALRVDGASEVRISDSMLSATGTCAVESSGDVRLDRCAVTPTCAAVGNGPVLGVQQTGPLQNGMPFVLAFHTAAGGVVGVWAAERFVATPSPVFEPSVLLDPVAAFPAALLVADGAGVAPATWSIPADGALVDRSFWFQGIGGLALPLLTSPLGGGVIR